MSRRLLTVRMATGGGILDVYLAGILTVASSAYLAQRIRRGLTCRHQGVLIDAQRALMALSLEDLGYIAAREIFESPDPIMQPVALVVPRTISFGVMRVYQKFVTENGFQHRMTHCMGQALGWLDVAQRRPEDVVRDPTQWVGLPKAHDTAAIRVIRRPL